MENIMGTGKIVAKEEEWLNSVGLSKKVRAGIVGQVNKYGTTGPDGTLFPNIDKWDNKSLRATYQAAMTKEVDNTVLMVGSADLPKFGNTELGRLMLQWQSFNFAFNNKVLISGLIKADKKTAIGFASLVGMGMVTEMLKNRVSGRENPKTAAAWIDAGLDRSGFLGLVAYGNSYAETLGVSYKQLLGEEAPAFSMGGLLENAAGPSGATISGAASLFRDLAEETVDRVTGENNHQFTQADFHRLRTQAWGQNVFYMKNIFDKLEKEAAIFMGLPKKSKKKRKK
jgi:hypothetical protein